MGKNCISPFMDVGEDINDKSCNLLFDVVVRFGLIVSIVHLISESIGCILEISIIPVEESWGCPFTFEVGEAGDVKGCLMPIVDLFSDGFHGASGSVWGVAGKLLAPVFDLFCCFFLYLLMCSAYLGCSSSIAFHCLGW